MNKTLEPTSGIHYREGYKGLMVKSDGPTDYWTMPFPAWFRHPMDFQTAFQDRHVLVTPEVIQIEPEFVWNFANAFPDFDWVKVPSMVHDALLAYRHWLIISNQLTEGSPEDRDLKADIDTVFMLLCKERLPKWTRFTPRVMFIAVNKLSRLSKGSQAEDHKIRFVA